ncbi:LPS-assembly protein LptD [Aliishimia ponticola]|uniref:LPS-assembly protein LptD n=1 Tax=Aliishimia ponticola TaxID=2499833 RepID=A0A4V3XKV7_9RHOB|nr:LPS assembly protein LptD [Aliishimia ponticola]THH38443.1 LPS-assembly protein LptD [Aliishimia ponticola]
MKTLATALFALAAMICAGPGALRAQTAAPDPDANKPAVLVADSVEVTRDRVLQARGNVEIFQGNRRLTAQAITYDQKTDTVTFEGPLTLRDGSGVVIQATEAELDTDLRNGVLRSARMVLDQQLQLAAVQINRVNGRYSQLYKTAVTACKICEDGQSPLWQIRAKRVIHDQEEQQLYFDEAQFLVRDVPIFYLPRLRLPDPTLDRATGFLIPSIKTTSQLSTGIKVPYFIALGDHRDLTLTPYLSSETRTIEFRYRQAFVRGDIEFEGAISDDTLEDGRRYYLFGGGAFDLGRDFVLSFDIEAVSDDSYLSDYFYSDEDRLDSEIAISRTRRDEYIRTAVIGYNSLRAGENNNTLPTIVGEIIYERRLFPTRIGGEVRLGFTAHSHYRRSDDSTDGAGRDVTRLNGELEWLKTYTFASGLQADATIGLAFDVFDTQQDDTYAGREADAFPQASVALRYPMTRQGADGSTQFLEPILQVGWVGNNQADVANDESMRVEFDEGNLLSLSRFPEADRREHGGQIALGLNWARYDPDGWESYVTFGQIYREDSVEDFNISSGLQGTVSDLLVATHIRSQAGLAFTGRAVFDEDFEFSKAELRSDWENDRLTLGGSYFWYAYDPALDIDEAVSEFNIEGDYRFSRHWSLSGNWRYDARDDRTAEAGLGIGYDNECVSVDLTVERRFASSTTVEPSTNFGFTIALRGFSAQTGTESYTRSCS